MFLVVCLLGKTVKSSVWQRVIEEGFAQSRKEAEALILAGKVVLNDQRVEKPGQPCKANDSLRLKKGKQYVSRSADKLRHAIQCWKLGSQIKGVTCIDVGASTGGFTQVLLDYGAAKVFALDVGTNQLAWQIRNDSRVESIEKMDFRKFSMGDYGIESLDFVVADISFISLTTLASHFAALFSADTIGLILIKPQFELPKEDVPKGGVIRESSLHERAISRVRSGFESVGLRLRYVEKAAVKGKTGNQEFVGFFQRI